MTKGTNIIVIDSPPMSTWERNRRHKAAVKHALREVEKMRSAERPEPETLLMRLKKILMVFTYKFS